MIEIRWHGRAGQGVVTAAQILADLALEAGLWFQAFPDYGPERSGAPVRAYTRLDHAPIRIHSHIQEPDVVVVLDPTLLESEPVVQGLRGEGTLIVNTPHSLSSIRKILGLAHGRVLTMDASRIAWETLGRDLPNSPMLGATVVATTLIPEEEILAAAERALAKKFSAEVVGKNLEAIRRGSQEFQEDGDGQS